MLVLTRKVGETIVIRDDIRINVTHIQGRHVRLGVEAPPSVQIYREELHNKINKTLESTKKQPRGLFGKVFKR